jgi:hypothetical protein
VILVRAKLSLKNFWNIKVLQGGYRIYLCIRLSLSKSNLFSNCSWLELSILFNNKRTGIFECTILLKNASSFKSCSLFQPCKLICRRLQKDFTKFIIDACISYAGLIIREYQTKSFENLPFTIPRILCRVVCAFDVMIESLSPQKHSLMDFPTFGFDYIYKTCFMCHLIYYLLQR